MILLCSLSRVVWNEHKKDKTDWQYAERLQTQMYSFSFIILIVFIFIKNAINHKISVSAIILVLFITVINSILHYIRLTATTSKLLWIFKKRGDVSIIKRLCIFKGGFPGGFPWSKWSTGVQQLQDRVGCWGSFPLSTFQTAHSSQKQLASAPLL